MALSTVALAQDGEGSAFVQAGTATINAFNSFVFSEIVLFGATMPWIVVWMGAPMLLLTLYFAFINVRSFKQAFKILRGHYKNDSDPGEVSQFQALSTALSGTVGLGNIAGVAVAISIGGPGATFWMIIIGFCAMSLKFAECTLAVKYRDVRKDGTVAGGPMYYLDRGLKARGWGKLGKTLAWSYAILAFPSLLQVAQVNQSYEAITAVTGFESESAAWIYGILLAIITAVVIIGGIRSIAGVTAKLVPLMAGIYIIAALVIIFGHITEVPAAFVTIFEGAFNPEGVMGGIAGVIIIGMKRAVYSTEAGLGSASMAHAAAKTREPVSEGMVALMEPFIDTVLVSTMTALVIVITGNYIVGEEVQGISMTSAAFGSVISWFPIVLALAAFLFGFSTIISWGYYSSKIWEFLWGGSSLSMNIFKVTYCVLLVPGAVFKVQTVYDLMDSMFFLMAIPNVIGIYLMAPELKRDLKSYIARIKSGEIKETSPAHR
jgi:AGCS family alanine or glycine:cation symporter